MFYPLNLEGAYDLVRKIIRTFLLDKVQVSEPGTLDHSLSYCAHNSVLLTLTSVENTQRLTLQAPPLVFLVSTVFRNVSLIWGIPVPPNTAADRAAAREQSEDLDFASQMLVFSPLK